MRISMRATVTIRDDLFAEADRVADLLGVSRSRLYQIALEAYLRRAQEAALIKQVDAVIERLDRPADDALALHVARAWKDSMGEDDW
jgi:metal-responsive CopG/Arc/MetJ family transcriptional regulator